MFQWQPREGSQNVQRLGGGRNSVVQWRKIRKTRKIEDQTLPVLDAGNGKGSKQIHTGFKSPGMGEEEQC
jgi:hypothetical protein